MSEREPSHSPASDFAARLLATAVGLGLTDIVLCPGSRSQALALAAAGLERLGAVQLHVRVDERSAAFFALGIAIETGRPVPVITTSGTAVANLHPAMLEAFHSGVPLIALTADRPAELIGVGANQATVQPGMFGARIPVAHVPAPEGKPGEAELARSIASRMLRARRPLHINIAFREPLSGALPDLGALAAEADAAGNVSSIRSTSSGSQPVRQGERVPALEIDPGDGVPTLVIAGTGAGPDAEQIAHDAGWPLLAEVTSGARFGRNLVAAYRELLAENSPIPTERDAVRRVIVLGHPTLSREIPRLLARPGLEVIVVGPTGGEPYDPSRSARIFADELRIAPGRRAAGDILRSWVLASRRIIEAAASDAPAPDVRAARSADMSERSRFARGELAISREPMSREVLVDAVWRVTWPHDRLVLGASRLVRELDRRAPGKRVSVIANRGQAGIDGTVATALGVATASQRPDRGSGAAGVTRVLLGDLTLLHDAGSLLTGQGGEPAPRIQLIVGNDGGGTIFDGLEVAAVADAEAMTRVMLTPQRVDLAALAAAYGWTHRRAATRGELEAALVAPVPRALIDVPLPR